MLRASGPVDLVYAGGLKAPARVKSFIEFADKGYKVSVKYPFDTSWTARGACKNVADAFGPAVQELLKQVVTNPQFSALAGK